MNEAEDDGYEEEFTIDKQPKVLSDRNVGYKTKEMRMGLADDFMIVMLDRGVTT